jgi:hypothetical protein
MLYNAFWRKFTDVTEVLAASIITAMGVKATSTYETSVNQSTRRNIPEDILKTFLHKLGGRTNVNGERMPRKDKNFNVREVGMKIEFVKMKKNSLISILSWFCRICHSLGFSSLRVLRFLPERLYYCLEQYF